MERTRAVKDPKHPLTVSEQLRAVSCRPQNATRQEKNRNVPLPSATQSRSQTSYPSGQPAPAV